MIKKGSWVQIHKVILSPEERTASIPDETKKVPLELWVKGFLMEDSEINETVTIQTLTDRLESGTLIAVNPAYHHDYGDFVPELLDIDKMVKTVLNRSDRHE
jgi:hypothetical protein